MSLKRYDNDKYIYGIVSRIRLNKVFMKKSRLTVRITADKSGANLSIFDDDSVKYTIDLNDIKDELKELIDLGLL